MMGGHSPEIRIYHVDYRIFNTFHTHCLAKIFVPILGLKHIHRNSQLLLLIGRISTYLIFFRQTNK